MPDWLFESWAVLVIILFIATVVSGIISKLTGWNKLAEVYGIPQPFSGKRFRFCSIGCKVGFVGVRFGGGYNNCATIGADSAGLHFWMMIVFRVGHPPLFIPWEDISFGERRVLFRTMTTLQFARCPSVPFMITQSLAEKLKDASGRRSEFEQAG